jgi:RND superfamily putative drug exporter
MTMLDKRNWYLPRWLTWLPRLGLEAPTTHTPAAVAQPALIAANNRTSHAGGAGK